MLLSENTLAGKISFFFMCFFAAGLAFSISIAQTGLGIVFLIFIATLATRKGRATLDLSGAGRFKILYAVFFSWVAWRIVHIVISPKPVGELIEAREVWLMLIPLFVYLYATSRNRLHTLVLFFVLGTAASSLYGIYQLRADFLNMVRGRGASNMHHLNYAGLAALASLMGLGLMWSYYYAGHKKRALLTFLLVALSLLGLWLTKSRGTLAAFVVALPIFFYVQLHNKVQRWIFIVLVALAATLVLRNLPESIAEQYRMPVSDAHGGSQAERRDLWTTGAAMIKERPVIGWGERGYNFAYPRFQVAGAVGVAAWDAKDQEASHMHNDFINTWVLYGAVGLLLQLGFYFLGGVIYLRERFRLRLASDRPLAAAAAASLILMAFMGLTQCHFTSEIVQMGFWICVGTLFTILDSDKSGITVSN